LIVISRPLIVDFDSESSVFVHSLMICDDSLTQIVNSLSLWVNELSISINESSLCDDSSSISPIDCHFASISGRFGTVHRRFRSMGRHFRPFVVDFGETSSISADALTLSDRCPFVGIGRWWFPSIV
jgi:hypothetical protein